jgi:hypothetical protein
MKKFNLYVTTHNPESDLLRLNRKFLEPYSDLFNLFIITTDAPPPTSQYIHTDDESLLSLKEYEEALVELGEIMDVSDVLHHSLFQEWKIAHAILHAKSTGSRYNFCIHEDYFILDAEDVFSDLLEELDKYPLLVYQSGTNKNINSFICGFTDRVNDEPYMFTKDHIKKLLWFDYSKIRTSRASTKPAEYTYDTLDLLTEVNIYQNIKPKIVGSKSVHLGGLTLLENTNIEMPVELEARHYIEFGLNILFNKNLYEEFLLKYREYAIHIPRINKILQYTKKRNIWN